MEDLKYKVTEFHLLLDKFIGSWIGSYQGDGGRIFCARGCRECYSLNVTCTFPEAASIAEGLSEDQAVRATVHAKKILAHLHETEDLRSHLRIHRQKIGFCPFLEPDGSCGIYQVRPFSCRSLLSTKENRWCGTDFSQISAAEKRSFMESLDRQVVSFPVHYVAATQEFGQELELLLCNDMSERFGFALSGNLPFLIFLEREYHLSQVMISGRSATEEVLAEHGLLLPFVLNIS